MLLVKRSLMRSKEYADWNMPLLARQGLTVDRCRRVLFSVGCILLILWPASIAVADEPQKHVLLFSSENINRPAMALINPTLQATSSIQAAEVNVLRVASRRGPSFKSGRILHLDAT